ncbi:hypothetical protein FIV42_00580 [Persicimonas caeni]|uniref:Uncharacterized protein n=1 Tax=Persicimonas caeni TaxID=2292766 RepID=A0A4Y6PM02_PERCE|nr:hypothetical protein [Persicimonas caeni]QDG49280.1 hypothetical protein FIV42_00580 [Persicimonas caeni]QED30501.1 hypothetical protein FRD00_00575 [Persicimonas caeni]
MTRKARIVDEAPCGMLIPKLADALGRKEAIFLQQVHYYARKNRLARTSHAQQDGSWWTYRTHAQWADDIGLWSERTNERLARSLREAGVLVVGEYNRRSRDRTVWYRVDYEALDELVGGVQPRAPLVLDAPSIPILPSLVDAMGGGSKGLRKAVILQEIFWGICQRRDQDRVSGWLVTWDSRRALARKLPWSRPSIDGSLADLVDTGILVKPASGCWSIRLDELEIADLTSVKMLVAKSDGVVAESVGMVAKSDGVVAESVGLLHEDLDDGLYEGPHEDSPPTHQRRRRSASPHASHAGDSPSDDPLPPDHRVQAEDEIERSEIASKASLGPHPQTPAPAADPAAELDSRLRAEWPATGVFQMQGPPKPKYREEIAEAIELLGGVDAAVSMLTAVLEHHYTTGFLGADKSVDANLLVWRATLVSRWAETGRITPPSRRERRRRRAVNRGEHPDATPDEIDWN